MRTRDGPRRGVSVRPSTTRRGGRCWRVVWALGLAAVTLAAGCSGSAPDGAGVPDAQPPPSGAELGGSVDVAAVWEPQQAGLGGFHWVQSFSGRIISPHIDQSLTERLAGVDLTIRISLDRVWAVPWQYDRPPDAWPAAQRWSGSNNPTLELVGHDGQVVASTEANSYRLHLDPHPPGHPYEDWWKARFLNPPEYGSYRLVWDSRTIIAGERSPGALSLSIESPPEGRVFARNERARVTWTIHGSGCDRFDYEFYYSVDRGRTYVRVPDPVMPDANTVAFSREAPYAYVPVSPKRASVLVVASGCSRWAVAETPVFEIEPHSPSPSK